MEDFFQKSSDQFLLQGPLREVSPQGYAMRNILRGFPYVIISGTTRLLIGPVIKVGM